MIEELHPLRYHYEGVQPYVKVTAYELSSVDCSSDKNSGYYGETATLTANVAPAGYNFSGWNITGSNMTGNSFRFQGDVTAKANYSAIQYNVTLQNDGHGTIAASKTTGNIGDTITLSNTPNSDYAFDKYTITGSTLTGNSFKINTSNVTAKAWFKSAPVPSSKYYITGTFLPVDGAQWLRVPLTSLYYSGSVNSARLFDYKSLPYIRNSTTAYVNGYQFKTGLNVSQESARMIWNISAQYDTTATAKLGMYLGWSYWATAADFSYGAQVNTGEVSNSDARQIAIHNEAPLLFSDEYGGGNYKLTATFTASGYIFN